MTTKIKLLALFAALFFSSTGYADVDYACQNNCLGKGYMLQYCQQACSYNNNTNSQSNNFGGTGWVGAQQQIQSASGALNSLQQQQFENQQQMQMRELEMEKLRLENERLKQELNK